MVADRCDGRQGRRDRIDEARVVAAREDTPDRALLDPDVGRHAAGRTNLAARRRRGQTGTGDPGVHPLPQARRDQRARRNHPSLLRRPRLCRGAHRHPRLGRLRGAAAGRVPEAGPRRRARGARLDRRAALVRRQDRDDGAELGRLRGAAGRRAPTAGAEGRDLRGLGRRPLRRRHALQGGAAC